MNKLGTDPLGDIIAAAGPTHCLFLVPMRPIHSILGIKFARASGPQSLVSARICEINSDAIILAATVPGYATQTYYLSDLKLLIEDGRVEFYVSGQAYVFATSVAVHAATKSA